MEFKEGDGEESPPVRTPSPQVEATDESSHRRGHSRQISQKALRVLGHSNTQIDALDHTSKALRVLGASPEVAPQALGAPLKALQVLGVASGPIRLHERTASGPTAARASPINGLSPRNRASPRGRASPHSVPDEIHNNDDLNICGQVCI